MTVELTTDIARADGTPLPDPAPGDYVFTLRVKDAQGLQEIPVPFTIRGPAAEQPAPDPAPQKPEPDPAPVPVEPEPEPDQELPAEPAPAPEKPAEPPKPAEPEPKPQPAEPAKPQTFRLSTTAIPRDAEIGSVVARFEGGNLQGGPGFSVVLEGGEGAGDNAYFSISADNQLILAKPLGTRTTLSIRTELRDGPARRDKLFILKVVEPSA